MRNRFGLAILGIALSATSATPLWAQSADSNSSGEPVKLVKSAKQIRCELFNDKTEGEQACGASRSIGADPWITNIGKVVRQPAEISRVQKAQLASAKQRVQVAGKSKTKAKGAAERIIPVASSDLFINFGMNSTEVSDDAYEQARNLFEAIAGVQNWSNYRFEVAGHTDAVGSAGYNKQLSEKRAQVVADLLVSRGINRANLVVKGYGLTRPIKDLQPTDGMNRRVEINRLN